MFYSISEKKDMAVENKTFNGFKPYTYYKNSDLKVNNKDNKDVKKQQLKSVLGAAAGVGAALVISKGIYKHDFFKEVPDDVLENSKDKLINTGKEVASMLTMAGLSNIGAIIANYKALTPEEKKTKWHEAGFQIMNTSIPMLLVTGVNLLCDKVKALNNKPAKIIASLAAMVTGAMIATKITNANKKETEEKRKYTIKDSVANFDDIVATIVVGFPQYKKLNTVAKYLLPPIYTYCGARAGVKE